MQRPEMGVFMIEYGLDFRIMTGFIIEIDPVQNRKRGNVLVYIDEFQCTVFFLSCFPDREQLE